MQQCPPESLQGKQALVITNFEPRRIAGIKSAALTLGFPEKKGSSQAIFLTTTHPAQLGALFTAAPSDLAPVDFDDFLALEVLAGTIKSIQRCSEGALVQVDLGNNETRTAFAQNFFEEDLHLVGIQVPVLVNLDTSNSNIEAFKHDCKVLLFTVPQQKNTKHSALVKITKPVENGSEMF